VLLAYQDDATRELVKTAMGWNFPPAEHGARIMQEVVDRVRAGRIRAVVGSVVGFEDIPAAIEALAARETTGRVIALVDGA